MRGLRLITLLIPCLDGWGLANDSALGARGCGGQRRLPACSGGRRRALDRSTEAAPTRPVADYLALQRRYRNLPAADVAPLREQID